MRSVLSISWGEELPDEIIYKTHEKHNWQFITAHELSQIILAALKEERNSETLNTFDDEFIINLTKTAYIKGVFEHLCKKYNWQLKNQIEVSDAIFAWCSTGTHKNDPFGDRNLVLLIEQLYAQNWWFILKAGNTHTDWGQAWIEIQGECKRVAGFLYPDMQEDIATQAALDIVQNYAKCKDTTKFKQFAYFRVRKIRTDILRVKSRQIQLSEDDSSPDEMIIEIERSNEKKQELQLACLNKLLSIARQYLNDREVKILLMVYFGNAAHKDLAKSFKITEVHSRKILHDALLKLRRLLAQDPSFRECLEDDFS